MAKPRKQKPAPIISVAGFLFSQLNTTISRNPYFGANKQFLEQKGKTKPAGAKLYQHRQAVSYGIAGIDTNARVVENKQICLFSLVIKPKWGFYTCSNAPCVSAEFNDWKLLPEKAENFACANARKPHFCEMVRFLRKCRFRNGKRAEPLYDHQ